MSVGKEVQHLWKGKWGIKQLRNLFSIMEKGDNGGGIEPGFSLQSFRSQEADPWQNTSVQLLFKLRLFS